jgi:hypothetical protein
MNARQSWRSPQRIVSAEAAEGYCEPSGNGRREPEIVRRQVPVSKAFDRRPEQALGLDIQARHRSARRMLEV